MCRQRISPPNLQTPTQFILYFSFPKPDKSLSGFFLIPSCHSERAFVATEESLALDLEMLRHKEQERGSA